MNRVAMKRFMPNDFDAIGLSGPLAPWAAVRIARGACLLLEC